MLTAVPAMSYAIAPGQWLVTRAMVKLNGWRVAWPLLHSSVKYAAQRTQRPCLPLRVHGRMDLEQSLHQEGLLVHLLFKFLLSCTSERPAGGSWSGVAFALGAFCVAHLRYFSNVLHVVKFWRFLAQVCHIGLVSFLSTSTRYLHNIFENCRLTSTRCVC